MFLMVGMVSLLMLFVMVVNNILLWWSVFVMMDLIFVFLCKGVGNYVSILNYFIIQETLGLVFLVVSGSLLQFIVVMTKMGLAPFHYWILSIIVGLDGWLLMWFLTFQKVPFMGVLMMVFFSEVIFLILLGFFICYYQLLILKVFKFMLAVVSTETFNWILLGYIFSFFNGVLLFVYYIVLSVFLIPMFSGEEAQDFEWFMILVYMNVPLGVAFFVKIFVLGSSMFFVQFWFILVLMLMFMNFLSLSIWMVMKSSVESGGGLKSPVFYNMFFLGLFMMLV
uniref:NADH dehydrogenase subunit 2 n=1 Tax=Hammerschmidtiella sp. ZengetLiu-2016 TaxID=2025463 RepID=A0A3Q8BUW4_9BILA|nr:NADH dehydrogenase subunit 2 [Hammerschmidtiella sp. ZengetLiu-2016]